MTAEEYIRRYTRRCSNSLSFRTADGETAYAPWLTPDGAREAVMIARDEVLHSVCDYLRGISFQEYPGAPVERLIGEDEIAKLTERVRHTDRR